MIAQWLEMLFFFKESLRTEPASIIHWGCTSGTELPDFLCLLQEKYWLAVNSYPLEVWITKVSNLTHTCC
jgi:hypothetical protein